MCQNGTIRTFIGMDTQTIVFDAEQVVAYLEFFGELEYIWGDLALVPWMVA